MGYIKRLIKLIIEKIFILTQSINPKKIVVCNFGGKGYGDNPKYVVEEIIKQNLDYDIVWLVDDTEKYKQSFPNQIRLVQYGSIKGMYELATAKIWIDNCRKYFYTKKRKGQYYIQTWHGGIGIKQIEKQAESTLDEQYLNYAKNDSKMVDLMISNSDWCTKMYENDFWYDGEILECGSPRVDILFNQSKEINNKIYDLYNIDKNKKILLYAPTFRNSMDLSVYSIDYDRCINALEDKFGGEWIIFIRLHPNISDLASDMYYSKNIINVTDYPDMQELLSVSNILVTDFSSSIFEFSYIKKTVFIFATDYEEYIKERGFAINLEDLPFNINKSNDEFINDIYSFNEEEYSKDIEKMLKRFGVKESGKASESVVNIIKQIK